MSYDPFLLTQHRRIVLLTEGYSTPFLAKTAINLLRYRTQDVAVVLDRELASQTTQAIFGTGGQIPFVASLDQVTGPDALYVGIAPPGGKLPEEWRPIIIQAIRRGITIVSGLHDFLIEDSEYVGEASMSGAKLIDVRRNAFKETGTGMSFRPGCVRIHTVGHDCSVGKMVAALEVQLALSRLGHSAKFLATGQTGIMISGAGLPIDCIVSDFVNGAAEELVRESQDHDFLLVEGQGSITHPAYSAVTLGLLHGCAPDGLIFCYEAGRTKVKGFGELAISPLDTQLEFFLQAANVRHPCSMLGFAINSRNLSKTEAAAEIERIENKYQLPACDVYRDGSEKIVEAVVTLRERIVNNLLNTS
jgi:uncharacterized NAD-dependent epimerase/dehydratase family protein